MERALKEVEWEDPPRGDFLTDVKIKVLWRNEKTGVNLTLLKAPKGKGWDRAHAHPSADEWTIILAGEAESTTRSTYGIGWDARVHRNKLMRQLRQLNKVGVPLRSSWALTLIPTWSVYAA